MKLAYRTRWAAAAYVIVLTALSVLPSVTGPLKGWDTSISPSTQNVFHLPAYAVLVCFVLAAVATLTTVRMWLVVAAAAACFVYGVFLECLQAAVIPGRFGSASDVLWNTAGVATGLVVWSLWPNATRGWRVLAGKLA